MNEDALSKHAVRTIRLDDEHVDKLLGELDAADDPSYPGRRAPRYRYRAKSLLVHMRDPASPEAIPRLVQSRELSASGLSFLYGGFVHMGGRCLAQLITSHGTWNDVAGTVVRCRYVKANIHEVAIRFDQQLDPSVYCAAAVHSHVLLVEDDPSITRLVVHLLKQLNCEVDHAENGKAAVEMAMKKAYDVILMDVVMPVMDGFTATQELRRRGYSGMIVAATGLTQEDDRERCTRAGCDRYVAKPYSLDDLNTLIASLRDEPLFSTFHNDPSMAELVNAFVSELPASVRALEEALVAEDVKRLEVMTRKLRVEGSSYGFEVITDAAAKVERAVMDATALDDVRKDVDELVRLCLQARSAANLPQQTTR